MEDARGPSALPAQLARKRPRTRDGSEEEADVELGGEEETVPEDPTLQLFDLGPRLHRTNLEHQWAVEAKERATRIRFGVEHAIKWWDGRRNAAYPLERVRLKPDTGVHDFKIDASVCEVLRCFLADPANYDEDGFLMMAGTQFPGYGGYPYVHASEGHVAAAQEKRTTRVGCKRDVDAVLKTQQEVWDVVQAVRLALGLPMPAQGVLQKAGKAIRALHFLAQDETQQASFSWHSDGEDLKGRGMPGTSDMTTVIVHLSHECSGMRVWGCRPALYRAQGDSVAFPGSALHESLPRAAHAPAADMVRKVALFFN